MTTTHYESEQINLMALPEASPDANSELQLSPNNVVRRSPGRWVGTGILLASLAIVGVIAGTKANAKTEDTAMGVHRTLQANSICQPPVEGDTCYTEASYQECLAIEATGCTDMGSTRSCPPRYACMDESQGQKADQPVHLPAQSSRCPVPTKENDCDTQESYKECLALEAVGCSQLLSTFSCPPQYRCADEPTPVNPIEPPPKDTAPASQCLPADDCISAASHQQCLHLEAQGCKQILSTHSCPPLYQCATPPEPVHPIESQCIAPSAVDDCHTEESYQECLAVEASGCTQLLATLSCPPMYGCATPPQPVHPIEPAPSTRQTAPKASPTQNDLLPADTICEHPNDVDNACLTEKSYQQCQDLAAAGCQQIVAHRSCPMMYLCADTNQ